ncbi:hypothetical protein MMC08_004698 [Hypocenomyce scalaris]|nr:hypothetical protein [Hypocenomyce scalaris]
MASYSDAAMQQQRSQSYIPNLSYRSSTGGTILHSRRDSTNAVSTATAAAGATASTASTSPLLSESCPSPTPSKVPAGALSPFSPDATSTTDPFLSPSTPTKPSKKKGPSLFSFLSVKEPSQQAFLDYQENIRKQATARNGRITTVGMPGVSSAKLPPTVPKVNSKWDGVPQTLKEKEKEKKDAPRQSTASHRRYSSNATAAGLRPQRSTSTLGSHLSTGKSSSFFGNKAGNSSNSSDTKLGWETYSLSCGSSSRDLPNVSADSGNSRSTTTLPEMTSFFPQDVPEPPKIPEQYRAEASTEVPNLDDLPQHSVSPTLTPMETSPVTPYPPSPPVADTTSFKFKPETITEDYFKDTELKDIGPLFQQVTLNSNGVNILAPPSISKRKPKGYAFPSDETDPVRFPPEDDQPPSILKRDPCLERSKAPTRPPISSYFPVVDAEPTRKSNATRNKHGMRPTLRNKVITPWDSPEPSVNEDFQDTSPTPTKQSGKSSTRRKVSIFGR